MDIIVVGISGKAGSGKSTAAAKVRLAVKQNPKWNAVELIFAGAIYDMHNYCREYLSRYGYVHTHTKDGDLLQYLGTEFGRMKYGPDIWVKILDRKIWEEVDRAKVMGLERLVIVVPDVRFKNELAMLKEWGGSINVRLECSEIERKRRCVHWRENTTHPSEVDLDNMWEHFDIVADTSRTNADEVAELILLRMPRHTAP